MTVMIIRSGDDQSTERSTSDNFMDPGRLT